MTDDDLIFSVIHSIILALSMHGAAHAEEPTYSCEPVDGGRQCTITAVVFIHDDPPVESLPVPMDTLTGDNRLQCTSGAGQWDYTYRRILSDGSTGVVDYTGPMGMPACISAILPSSHSQHGVVWWMHNETHTTEKYRAY